ncbi:DUF4386 family protein [Brevundimonas sp.]|uniref:DUF4386 family protein n=1 Tax=Brevundimonas sp. TaxID=1871086 RepID=UPI002D45ACC7|nr:DUF4386 family protein [Brevundimonas sp.]HYC69538.1 DUF4386 family protein [Brevundimonas sp.]
MDQSNGSSTTRRIGIALILFAIGFNLPYAWLASTFDYPAILRSPPGLVLEAFAAGGPSLILTWAAFALAALLLAPMAVAVSAVTRRSGGASSAIASIGVAAGVTQAIGLCRWVYAVPGLAAQWEAAADPAVRASIETTFTTLHQFAGVGIGEAIGQSLTAFWLIGVGFEQLRHPRFGGLVGGLGLIGGAVLLLGLAEGLATVIGFDPGLLGLSGVAGFLILTVWMIWTGILCVLRPAVTS